MNQILTQDEVEALLKAVGADEFEEEDGSYEAGSNALAQSGPRGVMGRPSGLALISTQTTRFTYSQEKRFEELRPLLEDLTSRTVTGFRNYLIGTLEKEFSVTRVTLEHMNFNDFSQRYDLYGRPYAFNPFNLHPTEAQGLVVFEPPLSVGLVEGFMGGTLDAPNQNAWRKLTPIEMRLTERLCRELVRELEVAWQNHRDVQLRSGSTTPNPHMLAKLNDFGLAIVAGFSVSLRQNPMGQCYMIIPYSVMDQLHPGKHSTDHVEMENDSLAWEQALSTGMMNLSLNLSVELGYTSMTLSQLLEMNEGDVLPLVQKNPGQAIAHIEGSPKFEGIPGIYQGQRAVRLT